MKKAVTTKRRNRISIAENFLKTKPDLLLLVVKNSLIARNDSKKN